jgi:hypothetical protein
MNLDAIWLRLKFLFVKGAAAVSGFIAMLAAGVAVFQLGAQVLHWLKAGTWETGRTIAEAWPSVADRAATMGWLGVQRIAQWAIAQPTTWLFAFLAVGCFWAYIWLDGIADDLESTA